MWEKLTCFCRPADIIGRKTNKQVFFAVSAVYKSLSFGFPPPLFFSAISTNLRKDSTFSLYINRGRENAIVLEE